MTNLKRIEFQAHPFHLVSPSPWALYTSICLLTLTCWGVLTMHSFTSATCFLFLILITLGLSLLLLSLSAFSLNNFSGYYIVLSQNKLKMRLLGYYIILSQNKLKMRLLAYFKFFFVLNSHVGACLSYLYLKFTSLYYLNPNLYIYIYLFIILYIYLSQLLPFMLTEHFLNGYFLEMNNGMTNGDSGHSDIESSAGGNMNNTNGPERTPTHLFPDSNENNIDPSKITVIIQDDYGTFKSWDQCDHVSATADNSDSIELTLQKHGHQDVTILAEEADIHAGNYNVWLVDTEVVVFEGQNPIGRLWAENVISVEVSLTPSEIKVSNAVGTIQRNF